MSELEEKKEVVKTTKKEVKKPNYIFELPYKTSKKEYKIGDKIYLEDKKVIDFLTTKKIIKKWQI